MLVALDIFYSLTTFRCIYLPHGPFTLHAADKCKNEVLKRYSYWVLFTELITISIIKSRIILNRRNLSAQEEKYEYKILVRKFQGKR
jgi:hypothetical protein